MPHIHEKVDFGVEVFVVHGGQVLLRKHDKYKLWLSVGGHVELDEDPNQAAVREVKEEVGLDVQLVGPRLMVANEGDGGYHELIPPRFLYRHSISETHEHVVLVYFARTQHAGTVNQGAEQSEELKWFSPQDLDDPKYQLHDSIQQHAQTAIRELSRQ